MENPGWFLASFLFASVVCAAPTHAQGPVEGQGSMQVGTTTISVEGGAYYLDLPSTDFTGFFFKDNPGGVTGPNQRSTDHDGDGWGWRTDASVEQLIDLLGMPMIAALKGYYGRVTSDQDYTCATSGPLNNQRTCAYFGISNSASQLPIGGSYSSGDGYVSNTERDVDVWGVALEALLDGKPEPYGLRFKFGVDWRNIDQDTQIRLIRLGLAGGLFAGDLNMDYHERLDTSYVGAFVGVNGEQTLGDGWTFLANVQIGLYHAHASYRGHQRNFVSFAVNTATDSKDKAAGIAVADLGIQKNFGNLSLTWNNSLEWYSWVPSMKYNDVIRTGVATFVDGPNDGTSIGNDDAFSLRTGFRLSIKLGP